VETSSISPFLFTLPVDVTAGVSGFEGGEVVFEVIWQFDIEIQLG
jgi:hypothetical protein